MALASLLPPRMADLAAVKYVDEFQWVTGETPMTSWQFLLMVHVVYASALVLLTHVMKDREPPKSFVKVYGFIHNIWMSLLSGVMLFGIVFAAYYHGRMSSLESFLCHRSFDVQPGLLQFSMYVFYVSKMMEFIDTFLLVLSKKKLIWLHKIHHLTTMSLVWHAMDARLPAEILCGGLNCLVHLIMYFYFAKPIRALRSTITFTQITQFVLVLVALLYAQVLRHQGAACTGTPLAEWHGIIMYGVYLGMFTNFFFQQYLRKQAKNKKDHGKDGAAKKFASQVRVGGDLLLFPAEVFERDNVAATRILAKILALGIGGILCFANLPDVVGVPLGVLLMSLSMSWMYIVGQGCGEANFFQNSTLNSVVGTLALLPIARPLDVFREPDKSRAWFQRLVSRFFGLTKSHFVVYIFLLAFVPSTVYRFGWGGLARYWALPMMAMHFNIGTFGAKRSRSVYELLLPGLAPLVIKKKEEEPKKKSNPKKAAHKEAREAAFKELRNVPLYNLAKGIQYCTDLDEELEVCPDLVQRIPVMQKLWNMLGLQRLMREILLWKRRDFALHLALAVVGAVLLSSSPSGGLIWFPLLVLFVLSLFNTRATNIARQVVSKARGKRNGPNSPQEMLIDGKVYDVSDFIKQHPGGSVIKFGLKTNATTTFVEFHSRSKKARKFLNSLPSREATAEDIQLFSLGQKTGLLEDFAKMRAEFVKEGLFKPSYSHIAYRLGELLAMHVVGAYMLFGCSSPPLRFVGLLCLGLAQGRCGWLMHEGGHNSLTGNITIDQHIQMLVFGLGCGMSGGWWRNQHNKHHATPQRLKHDVDLDTLPLVAFHSTVAHKVTSPLLKTWLQYQGILFAPVSTLLVTLGWQLFLHPRHCLRKGLYIEIFWIGLRYALWACAGRAAGMSAATSFLAYVAYVYFGGAYIFINFSVSHTHRDVVGEDEKNIDWVRYASNHTTNCTPGRICNWWMSYLNFQIEHHLFPSMPQFNHPSIAPRVKALFKKHGLVYDVRDYWECMRVTFKNLHDVGQSTKKTASQTSDTSSKSANNGKENIKEVKIVLHGKELNVTQWMSKHPGGSKIFKILNGRDATEQFVAFHTKEATQMMEKMIKNAPAITEDHPAFIKAGTRKFKMVKAFAEFQEGLRKQGLFRSNPLDEVLKAGGNLATFAVSCYLLTCTEYYYCGATLCALAMQQAGWIGHDYSHHSVFASPRLNDWFAAFFAWTQCYEIMWWKARHNTHHVVTNEVGNDPDIKTAPLLTYVSKLAPLTKPLTWLQRQQHMYFIPLLGVLHIYWSVESIMFISARLPSMLPSAIFLAARFVLEYLLFAKAGVCPWLFCKILKGFATGFCVFATHYAEERLPTDHDLSFVEQSVKTSRNISGGWLMDKFSGFISIQTEHHLFPRMPTANYYKVRPLVKDFCKEHGLEYQEDSLATCMMRNVEHLRKSSASHHKLS